MKTNILNTIVRYTMLSNVQITDLQEHAIKIMETENATFFVCISDSVDILRFNARDSRLSGIINKRRYNSVCLFVNRGNVERVTADNWKKIQGIITPKRERFVNDKIAFEPKQEHEKLFEIGTECIVYKKPSKRGFWKTQHAGQKLEELRRPGIHKGY